MDMDSAKSEVKGLRKKMVVASLYEKVTKPPQKMFQNVLTLFILDQTRLEFLYLADPGEARGCSTNAFAIH